MSKLGNLYLVIMMNEYTWRVIQNCKFVGYVLSGSEIGALRKAKEKYGKDVWVERILTSSVS
jgi:hypothetical protein